MFESRLRLHFLSLILLCCVSPSTSFYTFTYDVACHPNQTQALTEFMNEFDSNHCNLSDPFNGLTGSFPLVRILTKLSFLDLSNNHFSGSLNPKSTSLFELHHLSYLDLGDNNFNTSLPSEFGNLTKLEGLDLSYNEFFGQVPPTISNLTMLSFLYFKDNHFSGAIPSSLFTMTFLSNLILIGNDLTGSIEFDNSTTPSKLEYLYLGHNYFEGNIIEPISKLINLKELDLSFLNTSYPVDLHFSSLKYLSVLDFSGNRISPASLDTNSDIPTNLEGLYLQGCGINEFPNILKNLDKLETIALSNNRIKGKIPEWLWNLPSLNTVMLSNNLFNGFEGPVDVLVNSPMKNLGIAVNCFEGEIPFLPLSINVFKASHNRFTGRIPLSICNHRSLTHLALGYNNLTGPIPQCLSHDLTVVILRKNNLVGNIPEALYISSSLHTLDVGHNRLTGKLPRSLQNCSSLEFLVVDNNKIKDKFPFWLKALPNLQVLILSSNKLYGSISPPGQGPLGFPELRIFEISDNNFTGSLPPTYFVNWKAASLTMNEDGGLYMLYGITSSGRWTYNDVETIDLRYKALIALNLSNNAFTGHIPLSISNLSNLESLDLSSNQLSGTIPNGLGSLSFLEYINVSHNQLKGEIPQGTQIMGQSRSSFEGNAGLYGLPLQTCVGPNLSPTQQPKQEEEDEEEQLLNWKGVGIGYGPGVLLGLAIAQVIASYKPEWLVK
ncbi:unnamed protein product, partial [Brassica napus]